ncbi:helix-turn-helix domain-containing protein [Streptomyces sp. NPDC005407]|uniref:helix-turn-helix domain-containing protein n=1 Tax=Streptomyces sp. NPDC005407 TaxID=3155340 RepID=UPI0033B73314
MAVAALSHYLRSMHLRDLDRIVVREILSELCGNSGNGHGNTGAGLTVKEVAELLGVNERQARNLASSSLGGRLVGGRKWLVSPEAVRQEMIRRRRPA